MLTAGIGEQRRRLADAKARHGRLVHVHIRPRMIQIGDRRRSARAVARARPHPPASGSRCRRSAPRRWRRRSPSARWRSGRLRRRRARGRRRSLPAARRRAGARRFRAAARTRSRAPAARSRATSLPRHGVVALLARVPSWTRADARSGRRRPGRRRAPRPRPRRRPGRRRPAPRPDARPRAVRRRAGAAAARRPVRGPPAHARGRAPRRRYPAGRQRRRPRRDRLRRPSARGSVPPTCVATCTSVASTCPETRTRSAGGSGRHAPAAIVASARGCARAGQDAATSVFGDPRTGVCARPRAKGRPRTESACGLRQDRRVGRERPPHRLLHVPDERVGRERAAVHEMLSSPARCESARRPVNTTSGASIVKYAASGCTGRNALRAMPSCDDRAHGVRDGGQRGERLAIEVGAAFGDFAQHDRGKERVLAG